MAKNTISIVTPNYNHGHLIREAIISVANQTEPVFEHIIVDDGSTDDSCETIRGFAEQFPHIRLIESPQNQGAHAALDIGTQAARGDLILFLGADDSIPPETISRYRSVLDQHPDAVLICGDITYEDLRTGRKWTNNKLRADSPIYLSPQSLMQQQRRGIDAVSSGAAILRRDALLAAGSWDPRAKWYADWLAYHVVGFRHGVWYTPQVLRRFVLTGANYANKASNWDLQEDALAFLFQQLDTPALADVKPFFKASGILGCCQSVLRYALVHSNGRQYINAAFLQYSALYTVFRAIGNFVPDILKTHYVNLRTRRTTAGATSA